MEIDFVIPWVDGSDPDWLRLQNRYCLSPEDGEACRFRDWDVLKFWFRAVKKHAPWVRRIHFVTCGQLPEWLNVDHPKLHWVKHEDYIPKEYLPTFSSHTIELNLHRISGLSEHFVYFNDDMFLNAPVAPEDFFRNGLPRESAILDAALPSDKRDVYIHAQRNVMAFLNAHFNKQQVIKSNPRLWFHPGYGKYNLKNLYCSFGEMFSGIKSFHLPSSMRRSTFERVWQLEPELLHNTCTNKFRSLGDVNQYIMSYYNICTGNFSPRSAAFGKCYGIQRDSSKIYDDILRSRHKVLCINDHPDVTDFDEEKGNLISVFEEKYPEISSYEID